MPGINIEKSTLSCNDICMTWFNTTCNDNVTDDYHMEMIYQHACIHVHAHDTCTYHTAGIFFGSKVVAVFADLSYVSRIWHLKNLTHAHKEMLQVDIHVQVHVLPHFQPATTRYHIGAHFLHLCHYITWTSAKILLCKTCFDYSTFTLKSPVYKNPCGIFHLDVWKRRVMWSSV